MYRLGQFTHEIHPREAFALGCGLSQSFQQSSLTDHPQQHTGFIDIFLVVVAATVVVVVVIVLFFALSRSP